MNIRRQRLLKESLRRSLLTENVVCSTADIPCECVNSLPSQQSNCTGTRTNYCNGGYTDDCMCCGGDSRVDDGDGGTGWKPGMGGEDAPLDMRR
jgi:hypothetical protein